MTAGVAKENMKAQPQEIERRRAALLRVDLRKMSDACNRKWFGGKLPNVRVRWVTPGDIDFMPEGGHWWPEATKINIRLSAHANPYSGYQLLHTMVHEMVHVYISYRNSVDSGRYPVGTEAFVKLRSGKRKWRSNGEIFGSQGRRINENYPVLSILDVQCGLPRKHRLYPVWNAAHAAANMRKSLYRENTVPESAGMQGKRAGREGTFLADARGEGEACS